MLKSVGRCIAGVVVLGVMAIAGCAPVVEEEVVEEPVREVVQPFAGIEGFSELDDSGWQTIDDLRTLIRLSSVIDVRIMGPAGDEDPSPCNRRLFREVSDGYIFYPGQVTWNVQQGEPGLWMKGDHLIMRRKPTDLVQCFSTPEFRILFPTLSVRSDPPDLCVPMGPLPPTWVHYWEYSIELYNSGCNSKDSLVDRVDPLVIIKPGFH